MRYWIDTNHWSYLQEGNTAVVARFRELPEEATLFMSVISQAELLAGIELMKRSKRRSELLRLYRQVVAVVTEILPITSVVAERFAKIFAALRRKGRPIETNDIWLGATAQAHGLIVVSNDEHFRFVDNIVVEDWTG